MKYRSRIVAATFATTAMLSPAIRAAGGESRDPNSAEPATIAATGLPDPTEKVGPGPRHVVTPDNHLLTPAGRQVDLPNMRPQAVALSPDGALLVTAGGTAGLVVIDPATGTIRQRVPLPAEETAAPEPVSELILNPDQRGRLSYTGLVFSPDGKHIYLSNVNGSIKVFDVAADGTVTPSFTIPLPTNPNPLRHQEIPAGLAVSADGKLLYVALSFTNRVAEIETTGGKLLRTWEVGMVPDAIVLLGNKAYVSNWAGRRPDGKCPTGPAGSGVMVRIDARTGAAAEGSVSVLDLTNGKVIGEILTGKHACGMALSPDRKYLAVANAAADYVSVIDTAKDEVIERIWPKKTPADLFGATPNALEFSADGARLYICNGSQNAVAVVKFAPGKSELEGLLPTAWYPGALVIDRTRAQLCVANIKGVGAGLMPQAKEGEPPPRPKFITGQSHGTLSLIPLPTDAAELGRHTVTVLLNHRAPLIDQAFAKPREGVAPVPVPARVGEPSCFKHVVYLIKENRTYDQVLGDMPEGDGDPTLCTYGEQVTPNQHRLCRDFVLLDNTYCSGILSSDGHSWSCSAITTDYLERSFAGFPRSYPGGFTLRDSDALAWSPAGFIWDAAAAKGRSVRIYGEFIDTKIGWRDPQRKGVPSWLECWQDEQTKGNATTSHNSPTIASIRQYFCPEYPAWGKELSDQHRASVFLNELAEWEKTGAMPNLMLISLPIDHTTGTAPGFPTPAAQVADNDLAFARIVEGLSRSRFWPETCVIAIEDDPQNGWDHVSAYRTTAYVASPYSRLRQTVHTQYNQTSVLRTIELILGLPPMNELDASATPMTDCFAGNADFTPWTAVPALTKLDQLNPPPTAIQDPARREFARSSAELPLDRLDECAEDTLNRILWNAAKPTQPYPELAADGRDDDDE